MTEETSIELKMEKTRRIRPVRGGSSGRRGGERERRGLSRSVGGPRRRRLLSLTFLLALHFFIATPVQALSIIIDGLSSFKLLGHVSIERIHQGPCPHQDDEESSTMTCGSSRRRLVLSSLPLLLLLDPSKASAEEEEGSQVSSSVRPRAPVEYLIPAARVKINVDTIEQTIEQLDHEINKNSFDQNQAEIQAKIKELNNLLELQSQKNPFTQGMTNAVPTAPAPQYLDAYQQNRQQLPLLAQPGARLVQSGEVRAWKRLKRQERQKEDQDDMRAALNIYTSALQFSSTEYGWNASPQEKSNRIRNNQLPDVKSVIQSDMGRRYLIRNELLTAMEDIRAEWAYQVKKVVQEDNANSTSLDTSDLVELAHQAKAAADDWFSMVDESDLRQAMKEITK